MGIKEEAREELVRLIADFNANPRKDSLSEEETREFISDLFKILGWNFKSGEVTQEEQISKGYVDYGFRLNGVPTMFVEDKKTLEHERLEEKIKRTDSELDDIIYKLYDITEDEKKIIEDSLK